MKTRFIYEVIVGIAILVAIYLFQEKGLAALALLAVHPFIGKKSKDERETQMAYRIGTITLSATLLVSILVKWISEVDINGFVIGDNWFELIIASFIMFHGISGLVVSNRH